MRRILLLLIVTSLKIAVILANSLHSSFLSICKVIVDFFQLPLTDLLCDSSTTEDCNTQSLPLNSGRSPTVSIFTQTEEEQGQNENTVKKSGTDVIIFNLDSNQKLVITQETFKTNNCENCKSAAEMSSEKVDDVTASTVGNEGSNVSSMSLERDVLDTKIESGSCFSSRSSSEKASLYTVGEEFKSLPVYTEDSHDETLSVDNANFNACNDRFSLPIHFEDFECLKEKVPNDTYLKCDGTALHIQKTSSPLKNFPSHQASCSNLSTFNDDALSQITAKVAGLSVNSDYWAKDTLGENFERRLSLPVKLNETNTSLRNFKLAQQKFIEEALQNTQRHEKSSKEIKYPFSSEISLDSKPNDGMEDKEVLSCSSYESLPVSDHLRNTCENNKLLNLYNENLHSEDKPDLSCIDNLVEAFNDLARAKITASAMPKTDITKKADLESLNVDGRNLQPSSFQGNSSRGQIIDDYPKLSDNSKDTSFGTDVDKRIFSSGPEVNQSTRTTVDDLVARVLRIKVPSKVNQGTRFRDKKYFDNSISFFGTEFNFEEFKTSLPEKFKGIVDEMLKSGYKEEEIMSDKKLCYSIYRMLSGRETDESDEIVEFQVGFDKKLEESAKNDQTPDQMKCMSSVSPNNFTISDIESFLDSKNSDPALVQACQQFDKIEKIPISFYKKNPINHNILATIVPLNEDEKAKLLEEDTPSRNLFLSSLFLNPPSLKWPSDGKNADLSDDERAKLGAELSKRLIISRMGSLNGMEKISLRKINPKFFDFPKKIVPLNEDEKSKLLAEDASSGDSASDNSVVTVKEARAADSKFKDNIMTENSD